MLLVLNKDQYRNEHVLFSEKKKNNILSKGDFYRIYYSANCFSTNGVFLAFSLKNIKIEKYFSKIKCHYNRYNNKKIVEFIKDLEFNLLEISPIIKKSPKYRIEEQLNQDFIKIFGDYDNIKNTNKDEVEILLKISGIWCDDENYGVTFRCFFNHP